ncbi:MAG: hypothetical protein K6T34_08560 [Thermoflavifilum sp.]|nr:hypothetical protein [Thermoflavifilum sp.]
MKHKNRPLLASPILRVMLLLLGTSFLLTLIWSSCQKTSVSPSSSLSGQPPIVYSAQKSYQLDNGLLVPKGSSTWVQHDTLYIHFPDSYRFIDWASYTDPVTGQQQRKVVELQEVQVTCKCEAGSGCSPFTKGNISGCATQNNECTKCIMTTSASLDGQSMLLQVRSGDVLDLSEQTIFTTWDLDSGFKVPSPAAYDAMFESDTVRSLLTALLKKYITPEDALLLMHTDIDHLPPYFYLEPVLFLGHIIYIPLNYKHHSGDFILAGYDEGWLYYPREETHACKCSAGGAGCSEVKSKTIPFVGTIYYCEAQQCTNCTLY